MKKNNIAEFFILINYQVREKLIQLATFKNPIITAAILSLGIAILISINLFTVGFAQVSTGSTRAIHGLEEQESAGYTKLQAQNSLDVRVSASSDDAEERVDLGVSLTSSDIELVYDSGGDQTIGMRFNGINIPPGAVINNAYIQFQVDEANSNPASLTIQGEDVDHAATFASIDGSITSRPLTNASIPWSPPSWNTVGTAGPDQQTPDISAVIQEIVHRPGWTQFNSLVIIIHGTGERTAEAYDGVSGAAPLLHVEFSLVGSPLVSIKLPRDGLTFTEGYMIEFNGTASDSEDGDLTTSLSWVSNLDGAIGSGGSFTVSNLSVGNHTITATVTDTDDNSSFDSTGITVFANAIIMVGAGDIASDNFKSEATAKLLDNIAGTVFTLGDNAYDSGTEEEFNNYYDPTWGRHKARTRPAPGNHEYRTLNASAYFNYFGAAAGDPDKGYYSYDLGDWHIIVLNSECDAVGGCESTSLQGQWLQADLGANTSVCTLAYWHEPLFASDTQNGGDTKVQDFWQLLYDAGADLVLNGHEHNYERFALQDPNGNADPGRGIREFVVGTGGGKSLYAFGPPLPNSEVRDNSSPGVLKLTLNPTSYDWEFIPVAGQTFTDSGSDNCVSSPTFNNPPIANDNSYIANEDIGLSVPGAGVLSNDTDADQDPLTAILVNDVGNGSLGLNSDGSFSYTPDANFNGQDTFTYKANDGFAESNVATVTINVNSINDAPVADANGPYSSSIGVALQFDGSGSSDVDGTITAYDWDFGDGNLGSGSNPQYTYTGEGIFTVVLTVTDDTDATGSITTSAYISAQPNQSPIAIDDPYTTDEDQLLSIPAPGVMANDSDPDGHPLTISTSPVSPPINGSLTLNADGSFIFTPDPDFFGEDTYVYQICDKYQLCSAATVTITINPINDEPVAIDDTAVVTQGGTLNEAAPGVLSNDSDPDGDLLVVSANPITSPSNGSLTLNYDGSYTYTHDDSATTSDSFIYQVCDTAPLCREASVNIDIIPSTPTIFEVRVATGSDDAEEGESGYVLLNSTDLELVNDGGDVQIVGMRFNQINIPPGVTVTNAYIQFQVDEINSEATSLTIQGEDIDQAATFLSSGGNISARPRTTAAIPWSPTLWMIIGEADLEQRTPDISSIIQEIVNRVDWEPDNSLALIITGTGTRVVEAYDGTPAAAPLLHIEYLLTGTPQVLINTPKNGTYYNENSITSFSGTAIDNEEGDLSSVLSWESNLDGPLGGGSSFSRTGLSVGTHTITATVKDSNGFTGFDTSQIIILPDANVLVGAGDIAGCSYVQDEKTANLLDDIPGTVFTLGDNAYDSGTDLDFNDCYDPTWGRHKARTRPAVGNHDYHTPGASGYYNYFGGAAGEVGKGYYSYNLGDWHIIALNSECNEVGGCDVTSPQGQWLQADLTANPSLCTLAYWHHPLFSSGDTHGNNSSFQDFWQLLYDAGADIVLNGHEHYYERFGLQDPFGNADPGRGIREFIVGTGGRSLYTFGPAQPNSEIRDSTHGVLKLTLHPTNYDWEFIPIAGQTFTDSGTTDCVSLTSNYPPVANTDSASTAEDTPVTIDTTANDSDVDGNLDPTTSSATSEPTNGSLVSHGDGTFTYTPVLDFNGPDSFTYQVCDTLALCDTAAVGIIVDPVNDQPIASNDSDTTPEDTPVTINVAANDSDVDGNLDSTTAAANSGPVNGSLVNHGDGTFTYTPGLDFNGADNFIYQICDTLASCDTANVSITVNPLNIPVADDDTTTVTEDVSTTIDVLFNDDFGSDGPSSGPISIFSLPSNGSATVNENDTSNDPIDDTISYTPDPDFNGSDSLIYEICDATAECDQATVTITISGVNDTPTASDDSLTTPEDTPLTIDATANDSDVDGNLDPTTSTIMSAPLNGSVLNYGDGTFTYSPSPDFNGSDSFGYQVCDTGALCDTAIVSVTILSVNDPPVANPDSTSTPEDIPVAINVATNDTDGDSNLDLTTAAVTTGPTSGLIANNGDGTFIYTPNADFNGGDSFDYQVCDTGTPILCDSATVSINVSGVNDPPVASDDSTSTPEDAPVTIFFAANDTDIDGNLNPTSAIITSSPTSGSVVNNGDGTITYTPGADFNGGDSFDYQVCDTGTPILCDSATVIITITPVNDPPVATDDMVTVAEGGTLNDAAPGMLSNDIDLENDSLTVNTTPVSGPSNGVLILNTDGSYTYVHDGSETASDSFVYEISDGNGGSNTATVDITITAVNDAPVGNNDTYNTTEGTKLNVTAPGVLGNDTDNENDPLTAVINTPPSNGSLIFYSDGSFDYTPEISFSGEDIFTYVANDGATDSNIVTVTMTVSQGSNTIDSFAYSDLLVAGTVEGDYSLTHLDDENTESITERRSGGKPDFRYSFLEHKWIFDVAPGNLVSFNINAWSGGSNDGDNFVFSYSTDDVNYFEMVTISNTQDNGEISLVLPVSIHGTVYIRVSDSNQIPGNLNLDTIYIDYMNISSETGYGNPPAAPSSLYANPSSFTQIDLSWTDNTTDEDGFYIERSMDVSSWNLIASVDSNVTVYSDTTVSSNTTYNYRVQAYNLSGSSSYSNTAIATTSGGLSLTANGYKVKGVQTVDLAWTGSSASSFDIYRNGLLIVSGLNEFAYTDNIGKKGGGTHLYQVCENGTMLNCSNVVEIIF